MDAAHTARKPKIRGLESKTSPLYSLNIRGIFYLFAHLLRDVFEYSALSIVI